MGGRSIQTSTNLSLTTIPDILGKIQRLLIGGLAIAVSIVMLVIFGTEAKLSTDQVIREIMIDKTAFLPGLEEALTFGDMDGEKFILSWLRDRHGLTSAVVESKAPLCRLPTYESSSFTICWLPRLSVQAFRALSDGTFLILETPVKFFTNTVTIPASILFAAILAAFAGLLIVSFKRLALAIHKPIMQLAEAATQGKAATIETSLREVDTLARAVIALQEVERHKAMSAITQTLAHDVKNSLLTLELAAAAENWDEFRGWKTEITRSIERVRALINDFGKRDAITSVNIGKTYLDLSRIGAEFAKIYGAVGVTIAGRSAWDQQLLRLDRVAIERAIQNLIKNAVEAGAKTIELIGTIEVAAAIFSVIDDGPGVPELLVPDLFQRGRSMDKPGGQGIGLFNVKNIVTDHGGRVSYERVNGRSVFRFVLPSAIEPKVAAPKKAQQTDKRTDDSPGFSSVLLSLRDLNRQKDVIDALAGGPVKVYLERLRDQLPILVYTDDQDLIDEFLKADVPILIDSGSRSPSKVAKQILNMVYLRSVAGSDRSRS
jgi:signal transduction histidine kinase